MYVEIQDGILSNNQNYKIMTLAKIYCPMLAEALKKYWTLRMYMESFRREGDYFYSPVKVEHGYQHLTIVGLDLKDALMDWSFNENEALLKDENGSIFQEEGEAHKFFKEHPEGFQWKIIRIVEL